MVWHVHYNAKTGKYQIWCTIIDKHLFSRWVTAETVITAYQEKALEEARRTAVTNIREARQTGCSAKHPFKCEKWEVNK